MFTPTPSIPAGEPSSLESGPASTNAAPASYSPVADQPVLTVPGQETPASEPTQADIPPTPAGQNVWLPEYGFVPPVPPSGTMPPERQPRRPRRHWTPALIALALLLTLVGGGAAGAAIASSQSAASHTLTIGASSGPAISVSSSTASLQQSVENVAKAVEPSVVKITSTGGRGEGVGSGDILTSDGYIVTNDHVVAGFTAYTVTLSNGKTYSATLVGQDSQDDLAVVKINATGLQPVAFADSSKVTVGEFAVAVGNPLNLQESATLGTVSAVNGTASESPNGPAGVLTGLIQTTATIAPGNSGGALVNLQGQLIGIPTLEETNPDTGNASGIGYAISSNRVQYVAQQIIQHGSLTSSGQGFLGIQAQDVTPQLASADGLSVQSGVLVQGFANDAEGQSPAQQAGLQVGDVITAVNGQAVSSNSDLASALLSQTPGSNVSLTVVHGSSTSTVHVTLGERPANLQG